MIHRRRGPLEIAAIVSLALVVHARSLGTTARGDDTPPPPPPAAASEKRVTLLYTTDIHGIYHPQKDRNGALYGGFAALDARVKEIRAQAKNPVFLFDSGDVMTGHPICDVESQGVAGGLMFRMMNAIGYDGWCLGNHDFDKGRENTAKIVELVKFPTVDANMKIEGDPAIKIERWKILEKDGVKLGIFGLMTEHLAEVASHDKITGITITPTAAAAKEAVAALTGKCDAIVALSHCGSDEDIKLCDQVQGIDVILSGHNHQPLRPRWHGKTIVTEGVLKAEKLKELNLTIKNGKVAEDYTSDELALEPPKEVTGDLKPILDEVQETIGKKLAEVIAKLEIPWKRDHNAESNAGNFFADAIRDAAKTDVAFFNSGGIRKNLAAGDITLEDVREMVIEGEVVRFELTGADLIHALEQNATAAFSRTYGILQVSGLKYSYKRGGGRSAQLLDSTVGGAPIDPKKTYTCATTDFVVDQHEKYLGKEVTVTKIEKVKLTLTQVAESYVRAQGAKGPIKVDVEGRMREEK